MVIMNKLKISILLKYFCCVSEYAHMIPYKYKHNNTQDKITRYACHYFSNKNVSFVWLCRLSKHLDMCLSNS